MNNSIGCTDDRNLNTVFDILSHYSNSLTAFALLVGLIVFSGCRSPSEAADGSPSNLNARTPVATIESSEQSADEANALRFVSAAIESNKLNVTPNDLKTKKNPKGDGVFIYVPQTKYFGVERYLIWVVLDSKAYALNSPTKMVTP